MTQSLQPASRALFFTAALLPDGWAANVRVEIAHGRFVSVQRDARSQPGDEPVSLALPGMSNVHSHGFQRGMAGLTEYRGPDADNFWSWRELMYRFVQRMTPDDLEAITAQAYVEMLESGFTRVGEFHYVHHDPAGKPYVNVAEMAGRMAAAAVTSGIGLTLLPVFYAQGGFGGVPPTAGQRRFVNNADGFACLLDATVAVVAPLTDAVVGIAPHSLRAVTPEQLAAVIELVPAGPIHIHAAEQVREVEDCLAWSGARPVQWLLDNAQVDSRWCLIHATHQTAEEIAGLARSGAVAGFCPITEANLGDGISPASQYIRAGGEFGIGTDSNVRIDVSEELRLLEYSQRLRDRARNVVAADGLPSTGRALFDGGVRGGAQALGVQGAGLVAGASADFISLDVHSPMLVERRGDALLDSFIFAGGSSIDGVWRAGRKVVANGAHMAREAIAQRFRAAISKVLQNN
ncbi:MAG: formimidoylglutamate deiminase [Pseudomonadota bacterium]